MDHSSPQEFKEFANSWGFAHVTSSPEYPRANGKSESAVKTAKQLLKKAALDKQDPLLAVLAYRNTPTEGMTSSPIQRMIARRTRTQLPIASQLLATTPESTVSTKTDKGSSETTVTVLQSACASATRFTTRRCGSHETVTRS